MQESDRRESPTLYFTLKIMRHAIIEASRDRLTPQDWTDNQGNTWVYCPNCWSYQWTTWGLRVDSEWRKCAPSCPSLMRDWNRLIESEGGKLFPIYYSCAHLREQSGVVKELEKIGYVQATESDIPGVGVNQSTLPFGKMQPKILKADDSPIIWINHAMRQQQSHAIFGPVKDFLRFTAQNHPTYLEVVQMEDGQEEQKVKKTYFLQYAPTTTTKMSLRQRMLWLLN